MAPNPSLDDHQLDAQNAAFVLHLASNQAASLNLAPRLFLCSSRIAASLRLNQNRRVCAGAQRTAEKRRPSSSRSKASGVASGSTMMLVSAAA
jgi:hypothetical protein